MRNLFIAMVLIIALAIAFCVCIHKVAIGDKPIIQLDSNSVVTDSVCIQTDSLKSDSTKINER